MMTSMNWNSYCLNLNYKHKQDSHVVDANPPWKEVLLRSGGSIFLSVLVIIY